MEILHLYLSTAHNFAGHHGQTPGEEPMVEQARLECVAGRGIRGDRYFDHKPDFKGQVTFFEAETHEWLCQKLELAGAMPSDYRRNIITRDADLNALIGKEFEIQGVRFIGTEEAKPCYWMDRALGAGAHEALRGKGGLRARILTNGWLHASCEHASTAP